MSILLFDPPGCVFIRIRKAGSTSIVKGLFGGREKVTLRTNDGSWDPAFDARFTFAFVRNPFERLVSSFRMFKTYKVSTPKEVLLRTRLTLKTVMTIVEDESIPLDREDYLSKLRLHALPMTHPYYHLDKAGFIGRFEQFDHDYRALARQLDMPITDVPHERQNDRPDYRRWFNAKTRARAESVLKQDMSTLGYRFGCLAMSCLGPFCDIIEMPVSSNLL